MAYKLQCRIYWCLRKENVMKTHFNNHKSLLQFIRRVREQNLKFIKDKVTDYISQNSLTLVIVCQPKKYGQIVLR